ncbi:DNA end-binding protein Ku [Streptosporangium album]|uniref:Non-homologous end joining protein Ku n=1 Tax=Streptosporangium album TaxID=47479 RepID=A0A7W7RT60_9ACTN|nr:Ku protein [Streptosporangium album]MBB4937417.1 DNA end-binding protein Ku [Streptosporangium album]
MRSIWKGAVSFGLVTIPVRLFSATERRDVAFHLVHGEDTGRIRFRRVCQVCGEEVPFADVAKGYELPTGDMVVLADDDFEDLPLSTSRRIEVLQFTPADQIDPIMLDKAYYLEPDAVGIKPYVLLRDALARSGLVAVVKVALRQRESLAVLRVRDGVFLLETMLWPDEVRVADFPFLEEDVDVLLQEARLTESLIETMVADFDPSAHRDAYREALQEVIEAKVEGREVVPAEVPLEEGPPADLMAALRASVEAAKKGSGGRTPVREKAPAESVGDQDTEENGVEEPADSR